jgi:cobalt-zinc-cadmium efflux system membrane fusion protein
MKFRAWFALIRCQYAALLPRQKRVAVLLTAFTGILLLLLVVKGCSVTNASKTVTPVMIRQGNQIKVPPGSPLRTQMTIKPVGTLTFPHSVSFPGIVEADPLRTVNILPPFTGRLTQLNVRLGDFVKKGQVLALIRSPDLAQAYADYSVAQSIFKLTQAALNRAQKVNRAGANAVKDIELAQSNHAQASVELHRAETKLKALGHNTFSRLHIKAPISGWITALNYGRGSYVTDPTVALFTISNLKRVWVTANISENLAGAVFKNQRAVVFLPAYPNRVLHGKVSFVSSFLDPDSRRNRTRITFSNPDGKLQPNMFATVTISIPQSSQIVIPITAVLMNNDTTSVYVEVKPWIFVRREVQLGLEDNDTVRVISGLAIGERVVTAGGIFVND